jgi:hypothetical protein
MAMKQGDKVFERSVNLVLNGQFRRVSSVREAMEVMLMNWPKGEEASGRKAARLACMNVIDGLVPTHHAREAFVTAAAQAGILGSEPDTELEMSRKSCRRA